MKTPLEAFFEWFDRVPAVLRMHLAHIFIICTTEDTSRMAGPPVQSLEEFRNWAVKIDFPLRVAARMFYIRSVFDLLLFHHKEILAADKTGSGLSEHDNIVQISSKQWEETLMSWKGLHLREMSDTYIHSWASWMIKLQMEPK